MTQAFHYVVEVILRLTHYNQSRHCTQFCIFVDAKLFILDQLGGASGVMVIVAKIGHGDTSSNPGLIAFHIALIPLGKV